MTRNVKVIGAFGKHGLSDYLVGTVVKQEGQRLWIDTGKRFGVVEWSPADGGYLEGDAFKVATQLIVERYGLTVPECVQDYVSELNIVEFERYVSDVLAATLRLERGGQ